MELSGRRTIEAPREEVWAAILDPAVLKRCVPGCTEMTGNPDDGFEATVVQKVGPVKATFKGNIVLAEMQAPERVRITGEGKGGAAGFAKGGADVTLSEDANGTVLEYDVEAKVGGKLAQLGGRVIDGFAKKMADQFFTNFKNVVEGPAEDDAPAEAPEAKKGWFGRGKAAS
ncbi:hypothetical protein LX81_01218 [Palleronia aestuarii]|uniref:Carbon monoxide dehydrogenase subunit G n=1 Tax=Palleronia aestuarii TaxID=568105 RepID=A0A2W7NAR9_9RHOB|nr:carbon monoxide dehydrogenase subunit G [Palleronia aestuarii]PZX17495.1 hypothetical protein LX81_01218 [Palleronia aestuarii]